MRNHDLKLDEYQKINDELKPLREEISRLEDEINRLMNGSYTEDFSSVELKLSALGSLSDCGRSILRLGA